MELDEETARSIARVYWNSYLMQKIIENVEHWKDRDNLELASQRIRDLCLQTPITRRAKYAIYMEQETNFRPSLAENVKRFLKNKTYPEMYYCVRTCSDVPESEKEEIMRYGSRNGHVRDTATFFRKIQKRMPKQIHEFEIFNRRPGQIIFDNFDKLPNLNNFIFRNTRKIRSFDAKDDELAPDPQFVATHVTSLTFNLNIFCSKEIEHLKCMIGPGLKHFNCHVAPDGQFQWFIEELMVDMALHNVQLETCQVVFTNPRMPCQLINALIHFLSERSKVMRISISESAQLRMTNNFVPAVLVEMHCRNDFILQSMLTDCPNVFHKAEMLCFSNLYAESFKQMVDVLKVCYSAKRLCISCSSKKEYSFVVDPVLEVLPCSLRALSLRGCKMSPQSINLIVSRVSTNLEELKMLDNSEWNIIRNFISLLRDLPKLKELELDMPIPPLLFPKIVEHPKLERFVARPEGHPSQKALRILKSVFENVEILKKSRLKHQLVLSNRRRVDVEKAE